MACRLDYNGVLLPRNSHPMRGDALFASLIWRDIADYPHFSGPWGGNKVGSQTISDPMSPLYNDNQPFPGWDLQGCNVEE